MAPDKIIPRVSSFPKQLLCMEGPTLEKGATVLELLLFQKAVKEKLNATRDHLTS